MNEEIKPIEIKRYACPVCYKEGSFTFSDYETALKHVRIPIDNHLPLGLVYHHEINRDKYEIIVEYSDKISNDHGRMDKVYYLGNGFEEGFLTYASVSSATLKRHMAMGRLSNLLSEQEFEDFKTANKTILAEIEKEFGVKPIRTSVDLEAICRLV